jgi:hypothetical protein
MTRLIVDSEDRKVWQIGRSQLEVEHDIDGRTRIAVHDVLQTGFGVDVNSDTAVEIADFIRGEK